MDDDIEIIEVVHGKPNSLIQNDDKDNILSNSHNLEQSQFQFLMSKINKLEKRIETNDILLKSFIKENIDLKKQVNELTQLSKKYENTHINIEYERLKNDVINDQEVLVFEKIEEVASKCEFLINRNEENMKFEYEKALNSGISQFETNFTNKIDTLNEKIIKLSHDNLSLTALLQNNISKNFCQYNQVDTKPADTKKLAESFNNIKNQSNHQTKFTVSSKPVKEKYTRRRYGKNGLIIPKKEQINIEDTNCKIPLTQYNLVKS